MRKTISAMLGMLLIAAVFAGCGVSEAEFNPAREITVVSREDGAGTRGAFIDLLGIRETTGDGRVTDHTTAEAIIANGTSMVLGSVIGNRYAIGYISVGSLSDLIKALEIDGAAPTPENIRSGAYPIARNFYIAMREQPADAAVVDFIDFILSAQGQQVVEESGYLSARPGAPAFYSALPGGRVVVVGSTSVFPVMEMLAQAYREINPGVNIEIHAQGSTAGITATIEGISQIAMLSRELSESERQTLTPIAIAIDGIAVIANNDNPITGLSADALRAIFTGAITRWSEAG